MIWGAKAGGIGGMKFLEDGETPLHPAAPSTQLTAGMNHRACEPST